MSVEYTVIGPVPVKPTKTVRVADLVAGELAVVTEAGDDFGKHVLMVAEEGADAGPVCLSDATIQSNSTFANRICRRLIPPEEVKLVLSGGLMLLLILFIPSWASAETITHVGDTNPLDEGWRVMSGVPGGPDLEGEPNWRIVTNGYGRWTPVEPLGNEHFLGEWSLTVRSKWNSGPMAQQRTTIFDGLRGKSTALTWDENGTYYYVKGQGDTLMPNTVPDGLFHTATIVLDPEWPGQPDSMVFLFDGEIVDVLAPEQQNDVAPGTYLLYWGDNAGGPFTSDVQYSFVEFTNDAPIPEPATLVMLAIAIGCVGLWKRWRR